MSADDLTSSGSDVRDLLGAYAVDAVDDVERRAVERLVEHDADAAQELAELRATAALLGSAVSPAPPAGLRGDVLAQIRGTAQAGPRAAGAPERRPGSATSATSDVATPSEIATPSGPAGTSEPTSLAARRSRRTTSWLAVAATVLGAAAIPSVLALQQAQQAQRAEQQAQAVAELLADPDALVVRASVEGGGTAVGVMADDRALFTATGMAEPDDGREYQLWVLRDGVPLPRDVMPDEDGQVRALTEDYQVGDLLAVTVEPEGGSQEPTTSPVVVLEPAEA
jgi:anti-sigma-K factor RskA